MTLPLHPLEVQAARTAEARDRSLNAAQRARFGVVHTEPTICRFLLRGADGALRATGLADGLASKELCVLDPACGPGAFLASAIALGVRGTLIGYDRDPEAIMMARAIFGDRVALHQEDALASLPTLQGPLLIMGNPPWAARVSGERQLTDRLLRDFRREANGRDLEEARLGVLSDAYVRFVRWSAELVLGRPVGVMALVTNASYLDGPVHRGMRAFLKERFDGLSITDFGGSALVARAQADANLFGVRPAAAALVARRGGARNGVVFAALRGTRASKLRTLREQNTEPQPIAASPPGVYFSPAVEEFPSGWLALDALFHFHREGVQTNRDDAVIDQDKDRLLQRLRAFAAGRSLPSLARAELSRRHYDPSTARRAVAEALHRAPDGEGWIAPLSYRPLDLRYHVTLRALCHRPRPALAEAMERTRMAGGWALLTVRKDRGDRPWNHAAAARFMPDNCYLSSRSSCRTRVFPMLTPSGEPNLSSLGAHRFASPRAALAYSLCVMSAAPYQDRFGDTLRRDYPRLPPPPVDAAQAVALGEELAAVYTESASPPPTSVTPLRVGHREIEAPARLRALRAEASRWVHRWMPPASSPAGGH